MTGSVEQGFHHIGRFRLSRQGKKLQVSDDPRTLLALPKDVPERTWAEILQKEENELVCFEIREEIVDAALTTGYEHYMEKQTAFFTVHCTAAAWLKLIDWHFYRHDPGEEPSSYPPCFIPKRVESWTPDEMPEPSVKDSWGLQSLKVTEQCPEEPLTPCPSDDSVDLPAIEPIPDVYCFPGKVNLTTVYISNDGTKKRHVMDEDPNRTRPNVELVGENCNWQFVERTPSDEDLETVSPSHVDAADSEVVQRVTDYAGEDVSTVHESHHSSLKQTTPVDGSLQGAGDSTLELERPDDRPKRTRGRVSKTKSAAFSRHSMMVRSHLPPLMADSLSAVSIISDCRMRNHRLDTQFDVSEEKLETILPVQTKKKT